MSTWRLFSAKDEFFLLLPSVLTLLLPIVALLFNPNVLQAEHRPWADFIGNVVFLNALHNLFSYRLILVNRDFRQSFFVSTGLRSWVKVIVFMLPVMAIVYFTYYVKFKNIQFGQPWDAIIFAVLMFHTVFLPLHHGNRQERGIGLMYDQINPAIRKNPRYEGFFNRERRLFNLYLVALLALILVVPERQSLSPTVFNSILAVCGTLFLAILGHACYGFMVLGRTNKPFFLIRLLNHIFAPLWVPAYALRAACHGIEYYLIYKQVLGREKEIKSSDVLQTPLWMRPIFYLMTLLVMLLYFPVLFKDHGFSYSTDFYIALVSVVHCYVLGHYYIDRQIFRMSNSEIRKKISPYFVYSKGRTAVS